MPPADSSAHPVARDGGASVARERVTIAPALPEDGDYLLDRGVTEFVDRGADLATEVRKAHPDGIDAIVDLATFAPDATPLRAGGRLASPLGAAGEGARRFNLMAQPNAENLERLARLIDAGGCACRSSRATRSTRSPRRSACTRRATPRASSVSRSRSRDWPPT